MRKTPLVLPGLFQCAPSHITRTGGYSLSSPAGLQTPCWRSPWSGCCLLHWLMLAAGDLPPACSTSPVIPHGMGATKKYLFSG